MAGKKKWKDMCLYDGRVLDTPQVELLGLRIRQVEALG